MELPQPGSDATTGGTSSHRIETSAMTGEDLAFAGVARLAELLRAGEVTPRELVELYLARIERFDPKLNAFVSDLDPLSVPPQGSSI